MILDLLKTERPREELKITLDVLREFKTNHTFEEDLCAPLDTWAKLEQLQEFLEHLVEGKPLAADTLDYQRRQNAETGI
jgi:hypothetical protein